MFRFITTAFAASAILATIVATPASAQQIPSNHLTWQGDPTASQNGQPAGVIMLGSGSNFASSTYEFVCVKKVSGPANATIQYQTAVGRSPRIGPLQEFTPTTAGTAFGGWLGVELDKPYGGAPFVYFEQSDGVHPATSAGQIVKVDVYGYGPNANQSWISNPCQ